MNSLRGMLILVVCALVLVVGAGQARAESSPTAVVSEYLPIWPEGANVLRDEPVASEAAEIASGSSTLVVTNP
ncbi:MAG TPA: hypothetical protein PKO06_06185, partial [Candidatus Ozemobacteraceae bacterium]|nr:hypothetical protein [Candidatus Ozemobacteraceae bacterium]